jgi:AraC family transcriptional regulator of adaptative response/methylated-DNA-[protein]-cysteine methyltransferase
LREASGVAQAIYAAGFGSARGFYETVGPTLGMSPSAYRRGGPGELLRWTVLPTPIGDVVAVAGDLGLALIRIVAAAGPQLPAELAAEFPAAQFERADGELAHVREVLAALACGRTHPSELPIDVVHTAFQARVWQSLRRIPVGQTRSYAEVAADIDAPRAVRAVGRACATNPVALLVPCHRVVRSDGKLGGYRWGLQVKADLLALENSA